MMFHRSPAVFDHSRVVHSMSPRPQASAREAATPAQKWPGVAKERSLALGQCQCEISANRSLTIRDTTKGFRSQMGLGEIRCQPRSNLALFRPHWARWPDVGQSLLGTGQQWSESVLNSATSGPASTISRRPVRLDVADVGKSWSTPGQDGPKSGVELRPTLVESGQTLADIAPMSVAMEQMLVDSGQAVTETRPEVLPTRIRAGLGRRRNNFGRDHPPHGLDSSRPRWLVTKP